jgi:hypothetical protein
VSIPKGFERKEIVCECQFPSRCKMPYHLSDKTRRDQVELRLRQAEQQLLECAKTIASLQVLLGHRKAA